MPHELPAPGDFGGRCLAGECAFDAELLLPTTTYHGLRKEGSYLYGTWRDADGNLLRLLRGVVGDSVPMRFVFVAQPGRQLARDEVAEASLWVGSVTTRADLESVTFAADDPSGRFEFRHLPGACVWADGGVLSVSGEAVGPAIQWFNTWAGGACFSATGKYRTRGTFLGREVEGFVGHEIHYFAVGESWMTGPLAAGREICWQQVANEYEDGSLAQATFAYGADGWGFAMVHEGGTFRCSTDVAVEATVAPNGYPKQITYQFLDESWTWRIDPQGERPPIMAGPMRGADGTCTRDGDPRAVRVSMGNSDWWTDGRADAIVKS